MPETIYITVDNRLQPTPIVITTSAIPVAPVQSVNGKFGFVILNKSDVGLGNVENVSVLGVSGFLRDQIDHLDSGYASDADLQSLSGQLVATGANLSELIGQLSGYFVNSSSSSYSGIYQSIGALSGTLNATGSYLAYQIGDINTYLSGLGSLYYPLGSNPSGYLIHADLSPYMTGFASGNYVLKSETGQFYASNNPLGFITISALSPYMTGFNSGDYALKSETGNFVSNSQTGVFATSASLGDVSGSLAQSIAQTGASLQQQINSLDSGYASQTELDLLSGNLNNASGYLQGEIDGINSSGFLTGFDSGLYALRGETGVFALQTSLDQSGAFLFDLATGSSGSLQSDIGILRGDLNSSGNLLWARDAAISGAFDLSGINLRQLIDNLSGSSVLLYGNQSIEGVKRFNDATYIRDLYVTGTQTIVNTINTNVGSNYLLLNATGGAIDAGIFVVTGNNLTGINDIGAIIGYDVPANKWVFGVGTRGGDLSGLQVIASSDDILSYSGFVDGKYSTIQNLFQTGLTLWQMGQDISGALVQSGQNLQDQIAGVSGLLSDFYPNTNPSGFLTGIDLSNYYTNNNPSGFITGIDTGDFYSRSNPSGFITGVDLSPYYTKDNPSGFITGLDLSSYYPNTNPSGFITGIDTGGFALRADLVQSGSDLWQRDIALSGSFDATGVNLYNQIQQAKILSIAYAIAL